MRILCASLAYWAILIAVGIAVQVIQSSDSVTAQYFSGVAVGLLLTCTYFVGRRDERQS